jgi:hypothetical protein
MQSTCKYHGRKSHASVSLSRIILTAFRYSNMDLPNVNSFWHMVKCLLLGSNDVSGKSDRTHCQYVVHQFWKEWLPKTSETTPRLYTDRMRKGNANALDNENVVVFRRELFKFTMG